MTKVEPPKTKHAKNLVIPISKQMWLSLRQISFDHHVSMAELTRNALQKVINKYHPNVDSEE